MRVPLPSRTSSEVVVASLRGGHAPWKRFYPLIESLRPLHSNDIGMWSTVTRRPAFVRSQSQCIRNRMTSSYPPRGRFHWMSPSVPKFEPSTGMVANLLAISCRCFHPVLGSFSEHRKLPEGTATARNENVSQKKDLTFTDRAVEFIGWLGGFYSRKAVLTRNAKTLYESCIDALDYEAFFKVCHMPDSFQSWFLIAHLHVWLCMVRLKPEGKDGDYLTKQIVSMFWYDVEQRIKVLGVHSSSVVSKSLRGLLHEFYGLTLAYDEGLLSDDRTLAAAIWRNLIGDKAATDPAQLARIVEYVRRQVQHMDHLDSEQLLTKGNITLLPLK